MPMPCTICDIDSKINTDSYDVYCRECILKEVEGMIESINHSQENDVFWNYDLIINAPWYEVLKQQFKNQLVSHETYEHICWHMEKANDPNTQMVLSWNGSFSHNDKAKRLLKYIKDNI